MGLLSALLFLGGLALIVGGIVGAVANRVDPPVGRDRVIRSFNVPSGPLIVGGIASRVAGDSSGRSSRSRPGMSGSSASSAR